MKTLFIIQTPALTHVRLKPRRHTRYLAKIIRPKKGGGYQRVRKQIFQSGD
jgi:hypothetical protein